MWRTYRTTFAIFMLVFAIYSFPFVYDLLHKPFFNLAPGMDIASASLLPVVILQRGDFALNQFQEFIAQNYSDPYFVVLVDGKLVSRYPVAAAVIAIPFYGIPLGTGWLVHTGYVWLDYPLSAFFPAKFASATISALAVLVFFFCVRRLTDDKTSDVLALVFAFGTSVWSTSSQGLWQQTPSILFQLLGIWFILRGERAGARSVAPGAFFFSAATISRLNDAIPAILFTFYVLLYYRSAIWRWILWSFPPLLFFFIYNAIYNGSPFVFGYQEGVTQFLHGLQLDALVGLLISPSRGLLIYSPFFIFLPLGFWLARRETQSRFYGFCGIGLVLGLLSLSAVGNWDGGWGYGTRLMTDLLPYAMLLLIPIHKQMQPASRWAFFAMAVYAAFVNGFALWDYGTQWHWRWENYKYDVWDWRENEPLFYLKEYFLMARQYFAPFLQ